MRERSVVKHTLETTQMIFSRKSEEPWLSEQQAKNAGNPRDEQHAKWMELGSGIGYCAAPQMLLAREREAVERRRAREAERWAKEKEEMKLSSAFRATEVSWETESFADCALGFTVENIYF